MLDTGIYTVAAEASHARSAPGGGSLSAGQLPASRGSASYTYTRAGAGAGLPSQPPRNCSVALLFSLPHAFTYVGWHVLLKQEWAQCLYNGRPASQTLAYHCTSIVQALRPAGQTFPPGSVTGGRPPPPLHGHWHRPGLGAVTCLFGVLCCGHSPAQPVNHL